MTNGPLSLFESLLPTSGAQEGVERQSDRFYSFHLYPVWGMPSYLNVNIANGGLLNGKYDAWCLDPEKGITRGTTYNDVSVYSSYGAIPSTVFSPALVNDVNMDGYLDTLQAINWIFNNITEPDNVVLESTPTPFGPSTNSYHYNIDDVSGDEIFTSGDVQWAIWKLLGVTASPSVMNALIDYDTSGATAEKIALLARTMGSEFVPVAGQDIGVILSPGGEVPSHQPTIIEVKTAGIGDTVFFDKNDNGLADAGEGIDNVKVTLWADTNGDGSVDTFVATAMTGDNPNTLDVVETGYYFFGPLLAGPTYNSTGGPGAGIVYRVMVDTSTLPQVGVGWANTVDPDGGIGGNDSMSTETLTPGEVNLLQDFGYRALDYGDNPDSYGTTFAANGARHVLSVGQTAATPALYLGALVDTESDGQPTLDADGDNSNNLNDEDGIQFLTPIQAGQTTQVKVTVVEADGVHGLLNAWIDFNGDGAFGAGEQVFTDYAVSNGMQTLSFTAPTDAVVGDTYARFRLSTDAGLAPTGLASNGEVEDYKVAVERLGSIGDHVWLDCNNNGIQDAGEGGVSGVTVRLLKGGQEVATATTNNSGNYLFSNLGAGSYAIQVDKPVGYAFTAQDAGGNTSTSDGKDSDVNATGRTAPIILGAGENNLTVDAGLIGDPVCVRYDFSGSSSTSGAYGNSRTYELSGVSVTATAWSRVQNNTDTWAAAYLGAYGGGLGVTDTSESGSGNSHTVDNVGGRDNYVVFQFSQDVIVDNAYLGYVVCDSDISVWIGSSATPVTTVNDAFLASMTHYEENWTTSRYARWADFNDGKVSGNVLIIAANISDSTPEDQFKIEKLDICTAAPCKASIGDRVWLDSNGNGLQDDNEAGVAGVTVKLLNRTGGEIGSTLTDSDGNYLFSNLTSGDYAIEVVKPVGYRFTTQDAGNNTHDATDSDVNPTTGKSALTSLSPGEVDLSWDAGLVAMAPGIDIEKYVRGEYMVDGGGGGEGLTPGFWKTHSSYGPAPLAGWPETGYSPNDSYEAIFGVDVPGTPTLLDALNMNGGGVYALMRHSTAALLNAANGYVDYAYSKAEVIAMTKAAVNSSTYESTKDLFATQNELGADLSTPAGAGTLVITPDYDADDPTGPLIPVGGKAVFTYVVTNTGEVALSDVQVTDDHIQGLTFVGGDINGDHKLDINETWTYTATEMVTWSGLHENTGTVVGVYAGTGATVSDSDKAYYTTSLLTASLGDRVWLDNNANGVQDSGEVGIGGVAVELLDGSGNVQATQNTDADGNYLFTNLAPGNYAIHVLAPQGYTITAKDQGGDDAIDSDIDPLTGKSISTMLTAGKEDLSWDAGLVVLRPGIDIEKTTNGASNSNPVAPDYDNEDSANGAGVPLLTPGSVVNWTYQVTNTGNTTFAKSEIAIVDDNGTPANTADDFSVANGKINYLSGDVGNDSLLSPGEVWLYKASGIVQNLTALGAPRTFDFSGNSALDGPDGNIREFSSGAVSVKASAFARDKASGEWSTAWLGSYGGGLGVTDSSEGSGGSNMHTVDNVGRDNYVLFEFNQSVIVDSAYLGYVVNDSDITVWIGTSSNAFNSHLTLSDAVLNGLGFTEVNLTDLTSARTADINAGNLAGNVLVLAAWTGDSTPEDRFKIEKLTFQQPTAGGVYENKATVSAPGAPGDFDLSHYKNPALASIGDRVWCDTNGNGLQDTGEAGVAGVTVKLFNSAGTFLQDTTTDGRGNYSFTNLVLGKYELQFVKPTAFGGFTVANEGGNDALDSDVGSSGKTGLITLVAGENNGWDAGLTPPRVNVTYDFSGNSATDGSNGNVRSYTVDGITVNARAVSSSSFDRDGQPTNWETAWLGAYSGGHGVTDRSEGDGRSSNTHTVDNVGRINYVIYEFSEKVVVDKAFLGYVIGDSDLTAWIGSLDGPVNLSNPLAGLTKEVNDTSSTSARWADINSAQAEGNVLVVAARLPDSTRGSVGDNTPDYFKIEKLVVSAASKTVTPIAIDLDGNGIQTTSLADAQGQFDLFGNGSAVKSGWLSAGDAFLAFDADGNGRIDDISELFGGSKQGDGFARLAAFDSNGDGLVDAADDGYVNLSVWRDANGNHQTDPGELISLADAGVVSVNVAYHEDAFWDVNGNLHLEQSSATLANGNVVDMTDIYFSVAANDGAAVAEAPVSDPGWLFA